MAAKKEKDYQVLEMIADAHGGCLKTAAASAQGISHPTLKRFVSDWGFERVARGIYLAPDAMDDEYCLLQLRYPQIVFSHHSALFVHDLGIQSRQ